MFDSDTIRQLWTSGDEFRNVAANDLIEDFDRHAFLFFELLAGESGDYLADIALYRLPFLTKGMPTDDEAVRSGGYQPISPNSTDPFSDLARKHALFLDRLNDTARKQADPQNFLNKVCELFPGIEQDITKMFPDVSISYPRIKNSRQLMVFVCGQCNLHCPYCFSHDLDQREIPLTDLRKIFSWAVREGFDRITPCGGEPLLYSHFPEFMELIAETGMTTYMASNFTVDISPMPKFTSDIMKKIYVHFTPETEGNPKLKSILENNIRIAKSRSIDVSARANLTNFNPTNALRWIDLTVERGLKRLNIALTIPSRRHTNSFTDPLHFREFTHIICRMVEEADRRGLLLGIAKPLPLCLFPRDIANQLLAWDPNVSLCGIHVGKGMNNLSLSTDLYLSPCLGLSDIREPFCESLRFAELRDKFAPIVKQLLRQPVDEKCGNCFLYCRGLCQGYCLSYKQPS